jgi:uncharacterized membrane protein
MKKAIYGLILLMSGIFLVIIGLMMVGCGIFEPTLSMAIVGLAFLIGGGWLTHYGWRYAKEVKAEMAQQKMAEPTAEEKAMSSISRLYFVWCLLIAIAVIIPLRLKGFSPPKAFFIGVAVAFITMPLGVMILAAIGKFMKEKFSRRKPEEK